MVKIPRSVFREIVKIAGLVHYDEREYHEETRVFDTKEHKGLEAHISYAYDKDECIVRTKVYFPSEDVAYIFFFPEDCNFSDDSIIEPDEELNGEAI